MTLGLADTQASQATLSRAVGLYEFGFAFAITLLAILGISAVRGAFAGVHEWHGPAWAWTTSGWIAVAIFGIAMYGGLAFLLEDVQKRQVLPVFRRGASRESLEGDLNAQLADLAAEAGVRKTL